MDHNSPVEFIKDVLTFGNWLLSFFECPEKELKPTVIELSSKYINKSQNTIMTRRRCTSQSTVRELEI